MAALKHPIPLRRDKLCRNPSEPVENPIKEYYWGCSGALHELNDMVWQRHKIANFPHREKDSESHCSQNPLGDSKSFFRSGRSVTLPNGKETAGLCNSKREVSAEVLVTRGSFLACPCSLFIFLTIQLFLTLHRTVSSQIFPYENCQLPVVSVYLVSHILKI